MDAVEAVEKILNYSFVDKTLLKAALPQTFPEGCAESSLLYKRLEFLGGSVLEVAFTNYIYHAYPNLKLNELRDLRIANVSNEKFARAAVKHNLYQYAIHEKRSTEKFIEAVSKKGDHVLYGELVKAPKEFANLVESIAGAVYIDVNYDVQRLWEIFRGLLEPIYTPDDLRLQLKPSSLALFRLADEHGKRIDFRYLKDVGINKNVAEVYLDGVFIAFGRAKNIHTAKLLAAAGVLQKLSNCLPTGKIVDKDKQIENPLTEEMTEGQIVFDVDSPHVEPEDVKGESFEICSTEKLQLQTELTSPPTASENLLTDEMEQQQMVIDEDSPHVEPDDTKGMLFEICAMNKWPTPIFSVGEERGPQNEQKFVCSVKIEIPTIEGSFHMKGDVKPTTKQAENSSADHMIRALESAMMSLIYDLQMPKSLDEKKKNLLIQEGSLDENKNLHSKKRRTTYEMTPNKMVTCEDSLDVEPEDVNVKSIEVCSTEKLQTQTGSSSFLTVSKNPLSDDMTEEQIVIDEDSPHVEPADVKGQLIEICSTEKLQTQTGSASFLTVSKNPLSDDMTEEQIVIVESSPHVEPADVKGQLIEICSTEKLQLQTESSSLSAASENPLTNEMKQEQMVTDKDSSHVEPGNAKGKLIEICDKKKWPRPIFSFEEERWPNNEQKYVCSVKIEIPTIQGTFLIKGDTKSKKKQAENSSAYHMVRAISNLQLPENFNKKRKSSLFCSKMDSDSVEKILNYIFTNKDLLNEALSQTSSLSERLLFVGEAALELAFTNHIYLMYPKFEAREMSLLRTANMRNKNYVRVAVKHNIYQFFLSKVKLDEKIKVFSEVGDKENDSIPQSAEPPKAVSDLVNSVAGAVFIDMNCDVKRLWEIFRGLFEPLYTLDDLRQQPQPLRTLICLGDKENGNRTTSTHVYLDDKCIARGKNNKTIDAGKMSAAKEALQNLSESMPVEIVMEEDRLDIEIEDAKDKLIEICNKRKWPNPVYSVENYERPGGFVCSAMIETPSEEGTLYAKGDRRRRRETAENSSATHLLRALEFSLKDDL